MKCQNKMIGNISNQIVGKNEKNTENQKSLYFNEKT